MDHPIVSEQIRARLTAHRKHLLDLVETIDRVLALKPAASSQELRQRAQLVSPAPEEPKAGRGGRPSVNESEIRRRMEAVERHGWNMESAGRELGMSGYGLSHSLKAHAPKEWLLRYKERSQERHRKATTERWQQAKAATPPPKLDPDPKATTSREEMETDVALARIRRAARRKE